MNSNTRADKLAGSALIIAFAGLMLAMAHHPANLGDPKAIIRVHAILDILAITTACGLSYFALRRGITHLTVLSGCIFYGLALIANLGATVVNGFVLPLLTAEHGVDGVAAFISNAWAINQVLATLGVVGTGVAILLWSLGLLRDQNKFAISIGAFGILSALLPIALLATGTLHLNVHGATMIYAAQGMWAALVGLFMVREHQ